MLDDKKVEAGSGVHSVGRPSVLVLGCVHLNNPGLDMHNARFDDMQSERRQQEILEITSRLKHFEPTHVALEAVSKRQEQLTRDYQAYLTDSFTLSSSEGHQIGFRIARELGHETVHAVDWMELVGNRGLGDVFDWAASHQSDLLNQEARSKQDVNDRSLLDVFRDVNRREAALRDHQWYIQRIARVGSGEDHVGIDWLRWWYQRNLIVYDNVTRLMDSPTSKVLVMFGAGHLYLLKQFLTESGLCTVVDANDYLCRTPVEGDPTFH